MYLQNLSFAGAKLDYLVPQYFESGLFTAELVCPPLYRPLPRLRAVGVALRALAVALE